MDGKKIVMGRNKVVMGGKKVVTTRRIVWMKFYNDCHIRRIVGYGGRVGENPGNEVEFGKDSL